METINIANNLFEYLVEFRRKVAQGTVSRVDVVRAELESVFAAMEQQAVQQPQLAGEYKFVKYPLVVLADEIVLTSAWPEAKKWEQFLLEKKYYGTAIGGNQFFKMLGQIEQMPKGVIAVFFYCLALGFRGGFSSNDPSVARLKNRLWSRVQSEEAVQEGRLFEQAYRTDPGENRKLKRSWSWGHLAVAAVLSLLVLFSFERFVIWPMLIGLSVDVADTTEQLVVPNASAVVDDGSASGPEDVAGAPPAPAGYTVQLGTFSNQLLAKHFASQMQLAGIKTRLVLQSTEGDGSRYLVLSEKFNDKAGAEGLLPKAKGASNLVTEMQVRTHEETQGQCLEGCL